MSRKISRNETAENAVGALHKLSGLVGIDTERIHETIRRTKSADVERGKPEVREEAKHILEMSLVRNTKSLDDEAERTEVPSLNQNHVQEILYSIDEGRNRSKAPRLCTVLCELIIALPLEVYMIYFGYANLENCPLARLPQWLLVLGVLWTIRAACTLFSYMAWKLDSPAAITVVSLLDSVANTCSFLWGLFGFYLIWGNWDNYTWEDPTSGRFCAHLVMLVSKFLVVFFALGWMVVTTALCCYCIVPCFARKRRLNEARK